LQEYLLKFNSNNLSMIHVRAKSPPRRFSFSIKSLIGRRVGACSTCSLEDHAKCLVYVWPELLWIDEVLFYQQSNSELSGIAYYSSHKALYLHQNKPFSSQVMILNLDCLCAAYRTQESRLFSDENYKYLRRPCHHKV